MGHKDKIVEQLTSGISFLFKKNKVTHIVGAARFLSSQEVVIQTKRRGNLAGK